MPAATILFCDVVGFSKHSTSRQQEIVEALTNTVSFETRRFLLPPGKSSELIALPTGDGLALAFLHEPTRTWTFDDVLTLSVKLQLWSRTMQPIIQLRIGIHVGVIEYITDINGNLNLCGDAVNFTQRIMDAANSSQILLSDAAIRDGIGIGAMSTNKEIAGVSCRVVGPHSIMAKHGLQLLAYSLVMNEVEWYSNSEPASSKQMIVSTTPLPKEIVGTFSEQLQLAQRIAFIQLSGNRLLKQLKDGTITFGKTLQVLWVFMPDPTVYRTFAIPPNQTEAERITDYVEQWRDYLLRLRNENSNTIIKMGLFKQLPYFGASFIDWDRPKGRIHVSPYVWNLVESQAPGYDLVWLEHMQCPKIYEYYKLGLEYLDSVTVNALN